MTDGDNTQQAHDSRHQNGELAECEPHCIHVVEATAGLLAECHRARRYLTMCGELLEVSELLSSSCEPGCERGITYCAECLDYTAKWNAEAGLTLDSGVGR